MFPSHYPCSLQTIYVPLKLPLVPFTLPLSFCIPAYVPFTLLMPLHTTYAAYNTLLHFPLFPSYYSCSAHLCLFPSILPLFLLHFANFGVKLEI
ncbi:unnamed protein product [Meloidogyne enterolobii]|uniref:Uncharacterized protein n=1 Tax=Meloidogyne enterolobii TaxID=390850 RepID=A0ACB1ADG5_MELEN